MRYTLQQADHYGEVRRYFADRIIFSNDGKHLITQYRGEVEVWNARTGEESSSSRNFPVPDVPPNLSPDGRLKAIVDDDKIKIVEVASERLLCLLKGHRGKINAVAFSPDGRLLASGSWDNTVKVWAPG